MSYARLAALSAVALLMGFAPSTVHAQETCDRTGLVAGEPCPSPPGCTAEGCPQPPASSAEPNQPPTEVAIATQQPPAVPPLAPLQQITKQIARVIVGDYIVHGPNLAVYVSRTSPPTRPSVIDSDCAGRATEVAAAAQLGVVLPMPNFARRLYGRKTIKFSKCDTPDQFEPFPLKARDYQRIYFKRKVKAIQKACRFVAAAARRGQSKGEYVRLSCKHLKFAFSNSNQIVLGYYGSGRSHQKLKSVTLTSDGRLTRIWRDGSDKDNYNRRLQ